MKHTVLITALGLSLASLSACNLTSPQHRYQGEICLAKKDWQGAHDHYQAYLEQAPDYWQGWYGLGVAQLNLNQPVKAQTCLMRAYELNRSGAETNKILDYLAQSIFDQNNASELHSFLETQTKRMGATSYDLVRQGRFEQKIGDLESALYALRRAEVRSWDETDKTRLTVYMAMSDFYETLGNDDEALRYARHAAFLAPNNPEVNHRLRQLGQAPGPTMWLEPTNPSVSIDGK